MSDTVWIKHPGLDIVSEVPASALPFWRQSGWDQLTKKELADREKSTAAEHTAAEDQLRAIAEGATGVTALPPVSEPEPAVKAAAEFVPSSEDATGRQTSKKENG